MQVVLSEAKIRERIKELGRQISAEYKKAGVERLYVVGILRGGFIFLADLVRELEIPVEIDFVWASSYGEGTKTSGTVKIARDLEGDIQGRDVLIVEDIVDTGLTMTKMLEHLQSKNPKSLSICSLLHKPAREIKKVPIRFLGFTIEDQFVVGYGLDYKNLYREYREIVILPPENR